MNLRENINSLWQALKPMKGIFMFVVILILTHFFWKFNVLGDELGEKVVFWGIDISAPFIHMTDHITFVVERIIIFLQMPYYKYELNQIVFDTGNSVRIIWGCTGIKQSFIFFFILLFTPGPWRHKMWYIPLGLFIVYFFNLIRISLIVISIQNHPEWFHFLHEYLLKYLFYGLIFGIWVFWEEKFNRKQVIETKTK